MTNNIRTNTSASIIQFPSRGPLPSQAADDVGAVFEASGGSPELLSKADLAAVAKALEEWDRKTTSIPMPTTLAVRLVRCGCEPDLFGICPTAKGANFSATASDLLEFFVTFYPAAN